MTAYVITGDCNIDQLGTLSPSGSSSARAGADTVDTNGFDFTIDQDTRYALTGTTSTSFAALTINANKGGDIIVDARYVRLIPYNSGSGNVPAWNTTISQGSASGKLIGVYSALNVATTATGAAMPASGYIKVKAWNGTAYAAGALTGITATATGADVAGWIEVVGDESATITCNRLGTFRVRGAWYEFQGTTTTGTRTTQYQLPTHGSNMYCPGVMVQSASATITGATWASGTATFTASAHGFNIGQEVTITGVTPSGYNVTDVAITAVTTNTFSCAIVADPGAWSSGGSAYVYEWYPSAGSQTALIANIQTDAVRGKWCWVTTTGLVSFGYDGTNSTGGYIPPSGRKLRVANIFFQNCTTAARTANALPNATPGTRYETLTTGGGVIDIDKANVGWYLNMSQPYSVNLSHCFTFETMTMTECASPIVWQNVGIGQTNTANTQLALVMGLNFAGGTIRNCTWTRIAQAASGTYVCSYADCAGFTFSNDQIRSLAKSGNATSGSATMTRVVNSTFTNCRYIGSGRLFLIGCDTLTWTDTIYVDNINGTTGTAIPMYIWDLGTAASYHLTFDGLSFGGLTLVQPYSGVLNINIAGCSNIKLRNLGTASSPLDMGGAYVDATWTRTTTTMTVTKTAHGLKANDIIAVNVCSDATPKAVTTTTATLWTVASAPTADTFTVTVANSGQTTGQYLSYYPTMTSVLVNFAASSAANTVKIQRCYTPHLRTGILNSADNSIKNIELDDVWGTEWGVQLVPMLNARIRQLQSTPALTAQTSSYGTHFIDFYTTGIPASTSGVSWSRTTTTATITSNAHGLRVGNQIVVTVTSDSAAIVLGVKTIIANAISATPANPANVFSFTCLNAGAASGTLTFVPLNGRVALQMNEATSETTSYVSLTGGAAFTSAGGLYMPSVNDQADFTFPAAVRGHTSFPIVEAVMAGGTIGNYDITYSTDGGTTYKNLYYPRPGGGGSGSSTNVTMTDTTGVASGDYVWGTNIAPNAKVTSITNGTTVVVDTANIGTVSGVLRFNQLPSTTVSDPTVGFDLKIRIKTTTSNSTAITSLYFFTYSNSTARAATYDLDVATVTINGLATGSRVKFYKISDGTILSNVAESSGSASLTTSYIGAIGIEARKASSAPYYKPFVTQVTSISGSTVTATALQQLDQ